jgi:hypothetical protein
MAKLEKLKHIMLVANIWNKNGKVANRIGRMDYELQKI